MSKMNLLVVLNTYSDNRSSNAPNLVNVKWSRDLQGIPTDSLLSQNLVIPAGATRTLFTGATAKKFLYLEASALLNIVINGTINDSVKPFVNGTSVQPGLYIRTSDITSLVVTNPGSEEMTIFFAAAE